MEYKEFINIILVRIKDILGEEADVSVHTIVKNNGIKYDGLIIRLLDDCISPIIYLNDYYTAEADNQKINDIAYDIIAYYQFAAADNADNYRVLEEYNAVKDRIIFKIINYNANKDMLEYIPYVKFLDLAAICCCNLGNFVLEDNNKEEYDRTVNISDKLLGLWNISKEKLFNDAIENTQKVMPLTVETIEDILMRELGDLSKSEFSELFDIIPESIKIPMYVMSNSTRKNGAACMFYKNAISDFSDACMEDLYIIPSSVHELILVPRKRSITKECLLEAIADVNMTCVNEEDILSYNLYYYSRADRKITML